MRHARDADDDAALAACLAALCDDWDADALAYQTAAEALRHPLYAW